MSSPVSTVPGNVPATDENVKSAAAWLKFAPCRGDLRLLLKNGGSFAECGMGNRNKAATRARMALRDRGLVEHCAAGASWTVTRLGLKAYNASARR